jgi:hypothetical protein
MVWGPCDPDHASLLTHHVPVLSKPFVPVASADDQTGFVQVAPPDEEPPSDPELLPEDEDDEPPELPELVPDDEPLLEPPELLPVDEPLPELPELVPDDEPPLEPPELLLSPPSGDVEFPLPDVELPHPIASAVTAQTT